MSQVDHNNFGAYPSQRLDNSLEKQFFVAAEKNHGRQQMFVLVDFDPRHLFRALFHVPLTRSKGLATLVNGAVVNEKQLSHMGDFLTLRERVEYRRRVVCVGSVLLFPKWDLDGPDMRFFGEWNPPQERVSPHTSLHAGPWVLDGRQMVADARDMTLLLAEAALAARRDDDPVSIYIQNPVPSPFVAQRGWNMQRGPFDAWWSGVRKAAETLAKEGSPVKLYAVCDVNPFAECTKSLFVEHVPQTPDLDAHSFVCLPVDSFALLGSGPGESEMLSGHGIVPGTLPSTLMVGLLSNAIPVRVSTMVPSLRHPLWNPKTRLAILNPKPENKWGPPQQLPPQATT